MRNETRIPVLACLGMVIGAFIGYSLSDRSQEIKKLQLELAQIKTSNATMSLSRNTSQSRPSQTSSGRFQLRSPSDLSDGTVPSEGTVTNIPPGDTSRQERRERINSDFVANTAAQRSPEYSRIFKDLGISSEEAERFKEDLAQLHKGSIDTAACIRDLIVKRQEYLSTLRSRMGEENYERYKNFEEAKPAVREFELLREHALKRTGVPIDPTYQDALIGLIRGAHAYTVESWDNPFDPLPQPALGEEMVMSVLRQHSSEIAERSSLLLESARELEIPEELRTTLSAFYSEKLQEISAKLIWYSRPREERSKELLERMSRARNMAESESGR